MTTGVERPDWALVLGGASSVWTDLAYIERILGRAWPGLVIAVNDVGCHWSRPLHHWVSLHPGKFTTPSGWRNPDNDGPHGWIALRYRKGFPGAEVFWAHVNARREFTGVWRTLRPWGGGSSGLLGVALAYRLGCSRVALAGIQLSSSKHFTQSTVHRKDRGWASFSSHRRPWERRLDRLRERTRSPTGWTGLVLGVPTREWFFPSERAA